MKLTDVHCRVIVHIPMMKNRRRKYSGILNHRVSFKLLVVGELMRIIRGGIHAEYLRSYHAFMYQYQRI